MLLQLPCGGLKATVGTRTVPLITMHLGLNDMYSNQQSEPEYYTRVLSRMTSVGC